MFDQKNKEVSDKIYTIAIAGSVDDGKSTLLGRMHFNLNTYNFDTLKQIEQQSIDNKIDFSLFSDGLAEERRRNITIDVANQSLHLGTRRFFIKDCPGHIEYFSNTITAAASTDIALILIDVEKGITQQTKRHFAAFHFWNIKEFYILVNKMDRVNYQEEAFDQIQIAFKEIVSSIKEEINLTFVPISGLHGENINTVSDKMPWYSQPCLLDLVNKTNISSCSALRLLIQNRITIEGENLYIGHLVSGYLSKGNAIKTLPLNHNVIIKNILLPKNKNMLSAPTPVTFSVEKSEYSLERGHFIVSQNERLNLKKEIRCKIIWLGDASENFKDTFLIFANQKFSSRITNVYRTFNFSTFNFEEATLVQLTKNNIFEVNISLERETHIETDLLCRETRSFILIDKESFKTLAVGMTLTS